MNFNEKKSALKTLIKEKANRLQQLENAKQQLLSEVIEIQGQIKLLDELIAEDKKNEK